MPRNHKTRGSTLASRYRDDIGIGGVNCSCCNPYNGRTRCLLSRRARRREKLELRAVDLAD